MKESCIEYLIKQFSDAQLAEEIFSEYISSVKRKYLEAKESFNAKKWHEVDLAAHAIKGNALSVNDSAVVDLSIKLRTAAQLSDEVEAAKILESLNDIINNL